MLAPALRRHARGRAFHQLEQRLLHAFARHIAGDRRIFGLARNLVDFVDVNDPALRPLDVVVARLQQLQDDILDILADIARFGQRRRIGHREWHIEDPRQSLRQQCLPAPRWPDEQDVRLGQLDIGALLPVVQPLVMVVHGNRENALRLFLADDIIIEHVADFLRRRHAPVLFGHERRFRLFANDVVAQVDAFIADEHRRPRNEFAHLVLRLPAERAIKRALRVAAAKLRHSRLPYGHLPGAMLPFHF